MIHSRVRKIVSAPTGGGRPLRGDPGKARLLVSIVQGQLFRRNHRKGQVYTFRKPNLPRFEICYHLFESTFKQECYLQKTRGFFHLYALYINLIES